MCCNRNRNRLLQAVIVIVIEYIWDLCNRNRLQCPCNRPSPAAPLPPQTHWYFLYLFYLCHLILAQLNSRFGQVLVSKTNFFRQFGLSHCMHWTECLIGWPISFSIEDVNFLCNFENCVCSEIENLTWATLNTSVAMMLACRASISLSRTIRKSLKCLFAMAK